MLDTAINIAIELLSYNEKASFTKKEIESVVEEVLGMGRFQAANLDKKEFIRHLEAKVNIKIDDFLILEDESIKKPWIHQINADNWKFWNSYKRYLSSKQKLSKKIILKLDKLTDSILDNTFNPEKKIVANKKGLVVGQVQSGKTANYIGLICKAADAGYGLIIVLAGIHDNLRTQTQLRIDQGFLGYDTQTVRKLNRIGDKIGVGEYRDHPNALSVTSSHSDGDFTSIPHGFNFHHHYPIVAVVKKNTHVLARLHSWLKGFAGINKGERTISSKSLLLIDDEADNASINISKDSDRAAINGHINNIINVFDKSAYVGYTATPFANVFIPLDDYDLFPKDFIINLPTPSNYIGASKIFGIRSDSNEADDVEPYPFICKITDYTNFVPDKHKKDGVLPKEVPDSLKIAVKCFIINCAIRRLRGQETEHNSMLIHVSRFQRWQDKITALVDEVVTNYRIAIEDGDESILKEFQKVYEHDIAYYKSYTTIYGKLKTSSLAEIEPSLQCHDFREIQLQLYDAVKKIDVKAIHGGSKEVLDYFDHPDGLSVIAIGGNKLSRGLTLEGLSVSYFLRASKMYDTLMQMGRWFGYRKGYSDLCRLFTSSEITEWFTLITNASEELREEFNYMTKVAGTTPSEYNLKVRSHPGILQISAANKLKSAIDIAVSWDGRLVESYIFHKDYLIKKQNYEGLTFLIKNLGEYVRNKGNFVWYNIPFEKIESFLSTYKLPEQMISGKIEYLIEYVNKRISKGELKTWRVALMSSNSPQGNYDFECYTENIRVNSYLRNRDESNSDNNIYYLVRSRLISPRHELVDIPEKYGEALKRTSELNKISKKGSLNPSYPSGNVVRNEFRKPDEPLILLYLLSPSGAISTDEPLNDNLPFVGYAISFPGNKNKTTVVYKGNRDLFLRNFQTDDEDELEYED
ncbi:Z1 domain-containing protein [Roseivirga sp. BDSF3-8]|uniref:Z1 domain-containing protein n=1 Tax=Roseivirga sp. BDSF3-8 TaxID=3241598 RepID=UPI003532024F